MTTIIDPKTYVTKHIGIDWQDTLDSISTDVIASAEQLQEGIIRGTMENDEDAANDAAALIKAMGLVVDAMMAFERLYVRAA